MSEIARIAPPAVIEPTFSKKSQCVMLSPPLIAVMAPGPPFPSFKWNVLLTINTAGSLLGGHASLSHKYLLLGSPLSTRIKFSAPTQYSTVLPKNILFVTALIESTFAAPPAKEAELLIKYE